MINRWAALISFWRKARQLPHTFISVACIQSWSRIRLHDDRLKRWPANRQRFFQNNKSKTSYSSPRPPQPGSKSRHRLALTKAGLRAAEIANLTWEMVVEPIRNVNIELRDHAAKMGSGRTVPINALLHEGFVALAHPEPSPRSSR